MEQQDNNHAVVENEKYRTRPGTSEVGRLYEAKLAALLALRCVNSADMFIASNADDIGDFDDVILFNKEKEGDNYIAYMVQLKHQTNTKNIKLSDFFGEKDFSLKKYSKSFDELANKLSCSTRNKEGIIKYLYNARKIYFVLYTNKGVNSKEFEFLKECCDSDLATLRDSDSNYSFDCAKLKQYKAEFLDKLVLLASQPNVSDIDIAIRDVIKKLTETLTLTDTDISQIFDKFLNFITKWAQSNSRKQYFLTKRDINNKLLHLLLNCYRTHLSIPIIQDPNFSSKCIAFQEIISDKIITVLDVDDKCVQYLMQYIYSEVRKYSKEDVENYKAIISQSFFYQNFPTLKGQMIKILNAAQHITLLDVYICLWLDNQLPLLLDVTSPEQYQTIIKILELFGFNFRVILLNKTSQPLPNIQTNLKRFQTLKDLDQKNFLLKKEVSFQGKSVLFNTLINNNMHQYIFFNDIIHIFLNDFNIGYIYDPPSDYFITRSFNRVLMDPKVLKNINNELFLIEKPQWLNNKVFNVDESKICELDNIDTADFNVKSVIIAEKPENLYNIQRSVQGKTGKTIHWMKLHSAHDLEWKHSLGSTNSIKSYQLEDNQSPDTYYTMEELSRQPNQVHIVSAPPGMGKSTLMDYLAHHAPNHTMWTLKINLNHHKRYYENEACQNSNTPAATHLKYFKNQMFKDHKNCTTLETAIFDKYIEEKKILIILDGYDEISIFHKTAVTNIAKILQREGFYLWLTTRLHVKFHLEEELNSISITLKPFTRDDQCRFLVKYFSGIPNVDILHERKQSVIEKFVKELLDAAAKNLLNRDYQFMGIPLQTKILADSFTDECVTSLKTGIVHFDKNFDLLDLYEKFIAAKTEILKQKYKLEEIGIVKYKEIQTFCALKILFTEDDLQYLNIETRLTCFRELVEESSEILLRDGIMIAENEFVHRTFAEYISAKWLVKNIQNSNDNIRNTVIKLLSCQRLYNNHKFLFNIIDRIVSKGCRIRMDIIYGRFKDAEEKLRSSTDQSHAHDEMGKSLLHLLALYGNQGFERSNEYIVSIVDLLLDDSNQRITNDLLGFNPLDYAISSRSFLIADKLCAVVSNLNVKINVSQTYEDGNAPIHVATSQGLINVVRFLISKNADVESVSSDGLTVLHNAAYNGYSDIISLLLLAGAEINKQTANSGTALQYAAEKGHVKAVAVLFENGADINMLDVFGNSALHDAALGGSQEIISFLLSNGMDINKQNLKKVTPLHRAAQGCQLDAVKCLVSNGADVTKLDVLGYNVLHHAAMGGSQEIVSFLVSNGMDINKQNLIKLTPLHCAAQEGQLDTVKCLVSNGADITMLDGFGDSVLHHAAAGGSQEILSFLVSNGMEINQQNLEKVTPLNRAAHYGQLAAVKYLVSNGADITVLDVLGDSVLHRAATGDSQEIISFLVSNGIDINQQNLKTVTPLHCAAQMGQLNIVKCLVSNGADITMLDVFGDSVLHHAATGGSREIISFLVSNGMDVNKQNLVKALKMTPLHSAAMAGRFDAVKCLVSNGADINMLDVNGDSVFDYVASKGLNKYIIKYYPFSLLSKGVNIIKIQQT